MAIVYGKNTAVDYAAGNLASFGKSYSRMGAAPLDMYEVWYDLAELQKYASFRGNDVNGNPVYDANTEVTDTSAVTSYVGQKVAYVNETENKIYHYSIELDGSLKEIGVAPLGDGKSVSVTADGVISLLGVDTADSLTLPRMKEDKSGIEWVPVSQVVQGDGNDNTTYTFTKLTKGEENSAEAYGFIIKTFFNGTEVENGTIEIALDVYTKSEVDAAIKVVADKIGVAAEGQTGTLYELIAAEVTRATSAESVLSDRIGVKAEGDTAASGVYAYVDGVIDAIVNGVDANKIDSLNELIAWVEAHPAIVEELNDRLDATESAIETLNGDTTVDGSVDKKIADAISIHETAADEKYSTKQALIDHESAAENKYATKQFIGEIPEEADATTIVGYINEKAQEVLDSATGGSSESAASVKQQLDSYKALNDPKVNALLAEVYGALTEDKTEYDYAADSRIDALEKANAAQDTSIAAADAKGAQGITDAAAAKSIADKNAADITALTSQLGTTNTNVSGLTTRLAALEEEVGTDATSRIDALEGSTQALSGTVTTQGTDIATLKNTTIPALESLIQSNTDKFTNYSTTEQMNSAINDAVADKITAEALSPYLKSADADSKFATITSVETIYKVGEDGVEATGLLAEEITRAKAEEKKLDDAIKLLTDGAGTDEIDSVKELIDYVNAHGATVDGINARLDGHDALLAGIGGVDQPTTVIDAIQSAVNNLEPLSIATAEKLGGIKSAADTVVDEETTAVTANAVYVDNETGVGNVKAITTDILVNGVEEFVIYGGNAGANA